MSSKKHREMQANRKISARKQ